MTKTADELTFGHEGAPLCSKCSRNASAVNLAYSGLDLCPNCFCTLFERRVAKANRDFSMLRRGETVAIAISGGKDSAAMLHVLAKMARKIGGITLVPILIDEGIAGYRDQAIKKAEKLCKEHGLALRVKSYKDFAGFTLDEMIKLRNASKDPGLSTLRACTICGIFRRYLINKAALEAGADKVAVGHNADDVAQTFLMNILRSDPESLERFSPLASNEDAGGKFVPRIKPLIYVPERECALYCEFKGLAYHLGECPNSGEAFRGLVKDFLNEGEARYPGMKFNVLNSFLRFKKTCSRAGIEKEHAPKCPKCKMISAQGETCKACSMTEKLAIEAAKQKVSTHAAQGKRNAMTEMTSSAG